MGAQLVDEPKGIRALHMDDLKAAQIWSQTRQSGKFSRR
jgi:hypothetical protein